MVGRDELVGRGLDAGTGYYEASWDTLPVPEDSQVTLRARATDSIGQTTEATPLTVTVNNDNQAPVASFTYTCSSNVCDFDGSGSSDADGATRSYAWVFGDGQSGAGTTVRHTFAASGTYTVALTVTDELGVTGTAREKVTIQVVNDTLHVSDLDRTSRRLFFGLWEARMTIRVADAVGSPVPNARVSGLFSDGPSLFQCTTNASRELHRGRLPVEPAVLDASASRASPTRRSSTPRRRTRTPTATATAPRSRSAGPRRARRTPLTPTRPSRPRLRRDRTVGTAVRAGPSSRSMLHAGAHRASISWGGM